MTPRSQAEPGPARAEMRSGISLAAKSSMSSRRNEKVRMVATKARLPEARPYVPNRAKMKKMMARVAQSASAGKMPICRESGKGSIVTRGARVTSAERRSATVQSIKYKP